MPIIPTNLADVEEFDNPPVGEYYCEIAKITYRPARQQGKYPQLMVQYTIIDGDQIGRSMSEWVSMSPKAAFRLKRWFNKFGLGDVNLDDGAYDDPDAETPELVNPDLKGVRVIVKVTKDGDRLRNELLVVDDAEFQPADEGDQPVSPAPVNEAPAAETPAVEEEEPLPFADEDGQPEAPAEAAPAPAPAAAPRRQLQQPAPATPAQPVRGRPAGAQPTRRTLR